MIKESIRKLPMFETFTDQPDHADFEWPSKQQLKAITNVKQLKLNEIRY